MADQFPVARIPLYKGPVQDRLGDPGRQIVEHHDSFISFSQLFHNVTADVTGPSGYKNAFFCICVPAEINVQIKGCGGQG